MQGTFQRDTKESLSVPAELVVHEARGGTQKNVTEFVNDPAGGGGQVPQQFPEKPVLVIPPPQTFTIDSVLHLISNDISEHDNDENLKEMEKPGYWLVPCVMMDNGLCRPEHVKEPLLPALKDSILKQFNWSARNVYDDMDPFIPDINYAREGIDFATIEPTNMQIFAPFLKKALDRGEELDYDFALRMQGLLNCAINAVWTCTEFGFDNGDRSHIMGQFLQKYIGRFLSQVTQKPEEINPDRIVQEAMQMHSNFSSGWVKEHKRGLSPNLDACSEALVGHFCDGVLRSAVLAGMTRKQIARLLRRHPVFSAQFGLCLHFFMVKLDQDKNARNANYKSMFNSTTNQLIQMRKLDEFLRANVKTLSGCVEDWRVLNEHYRLFHHYTVDWYYIVSQLHVPTVQYTGVKRARSMVSRAPGVFFAQT